MGVEYISSGVTSTGLVVGQNLVYVLAGATIVGTDATGGSIELEAGAVESGTLYAGGAEGQLHGSSHGATVTGIGTRVTVLQGGSADDVTVSSGGYLDVAYGTASAVNLGSAGTLEAVYGTVTDVTVANGGSVVIDGVGYFGSGAGSLSGSLTFTGSASVAYYGNADSSPNFSNTAIISGFQSGDSILAGGFGDHSSLTFVSGGGVLSAVVTSGAVQEAFLFDGATPTSNITLSATYVPHFPRLPNLLFFQSESLVYIACFAAGTNILTTTGERAVEALRIGDQVVTVRGAHRRIVWIGHRSYGGRFLDANPGVQPICFHAGSLGNGLPRRDLLVSPEHAMFLDGVLIPARCLVNGTTIVRQTSREMVEYFHVELDSHDVILAEGAAAETFVDDDSRGVFDNAATAETQPGAAVYYAPRVESGFALEAVRTRLARAMPATPPQLCAAGGSCGG